MRILEKYGFQRKEVLIVGDDPHSEIKAGREIGVDTVLYKHKAGMISTDNQVVITRYDQLARMLEK